MRHFLNPCITRHFIKISVEETAVKVSPLSFFNENRWSSFSKEKLHYFLIFYFIRS